MTVTEYLVSAVPDAGETVQPLATKVMFAPAAPPVMLIGKVSLQFLVSDQPETERVLARDISDLPLTEADTPF